MEGGRTGKRRRITPYLAHMLLDNTITWRVFDLLHRLGAQLSLASFPKEKKGGGGF